MQPHASSTNSPESGPALPPARVIGSSPRSQQAPPPRVRSPLVALKEGIAEALAEPAAMQVTAPACMQPSKKTEERLTFEDQLLGERIWWSENTNVQVRKIGNTMSQELEQAVASMREQLRQQLEIERQDRHSICLELKSEISGLQVSFAEIEHRSKLANEAANAYSSPLNVTVTEQLSAMEETMAELRRELNMLQAKHDTLRSDVSLQVQAEVLPMVNAQQATIDDMIAEINVNEENLTGRPLSPLRIDKDAAERLEEKFNQLSAMVSQHEAAVQSEFGNVRMALQSFHEFFDNLETCSNNPDMLNMLQKQSLLEELTRLKQDLLDETDERVKNMSDMRALVQEAAPNQSDAHVPRDDLKTIRAQLDSLSKNLEAERMTRSGMAIDVSNTRKDVEQAMTDMKNCRTATSSMESLVQKICNDLSSLKAEVKQEKMNAAAGISARDHLTDSIGSLRAEFVDIRARMDATSIADNASGVAENSIGSLRGARVDRDCDETDETSGHQVLSKDIGHATGELVHQIHNLGDGLRHEFTAKLEALKFHVDSLFAQRQSQSSIDSSHSDLPVEGRIRALEEDALSGKLAKEQVGELFQLMQINIGGTEQLARKIASESAMWRNAKVQTEARINYLDKVLRHIRGDDGSNEAESSEGLVPENNLVENSEEDFTLISDDLKCSLERLVSKLTRTLGDSADAQTPRSANRSQSRERLLPQKAAVKKAIRTLSSGSLPAAEKVVSGGSARYKQQVLTYVKAAQGQQQRQDTPQRPSITGRPVQQTPQGVQQQVSPMSLTTSVANAYAATNKPGSSPVLLSGGRPSLTQTVNSPRSSYGMPRN